MTIHRRTVRSRPRRPVIWMTLALLLLSGGVVLAQGAASTSRLVIGMPELGASLDPHRHLNRNSSPMFHAIFDGLTSQDAGGAVTPNLASSWEAVEPTRWRFTLRPGVTFSNGEALTAETVRYSIERVMNPDTGSILASNFPTLTGVEVVDELTVDVLTNQPDGLLPGLLSQLMIIPLSAAQHIDAEGIITEPVGTGPYVLSQYDRGIVTVLTARADAWEDAPSVTEVRFQVIPDASVRASALRTGEIDIGTALTPDQVAELEGSAVQVADLPSGSILQLPLIGHRGPPLSDKRVRQAINYAIDRGSIIEFIMGGYAQPAFGQLALEGANGFNPDVQGYTYDPERAKALLAEAGYANGFAMTIVAAEGRYTNDKQVIEAIAAYLQQVGIQLEWQRTEASEVSRMTYAGEIDHTLLVIYDFRSTMDLALPASRYLQTDPRLVHSGVDLFDQLHAEALQETDFDARGAKLRQMAEVFADEAMAVVLFGLVDLIGYGPSVDSFSPNMYSIIDVANVVKR